MRIVLLSVEIGTHQFAFVHERLRSEFTEDATLRTIVSLRHKRMALPILPQYKGSKPERVNCAVESAVRRLI